MRSWCGMGRFWAREARASASDSLDAFSRSKAFARSRSIGRKRPRPSGTTAARASCPGFSRGFPLRCGITSVRAISLHSHAGSGRPPASFFVTTACSRPARSSRTDLAGSASATRSCVGTTRLARQVEGLLNRVPGVHRATFSTWTKSLLIRYDASVIATGRIVRLVEEALDRLGGWGRALGAQVKTRYALPNANLGIAALADFAVPALMPLSAVFLVGINLRTFRAAWLQVRRRKFGLPVLYTVIVMATLANGQFFASALMTWFFKFWQGRLRSELASERRRLLDACLPLPRLCRLVTAGGGEVLAPVDRLREGDRIEVGSDEPVPADGRVIEGGGIVDERSVRGLGGASRKRPGDTVLAGSTVLAGWLRIEVAGPSDRTRATKIGRSLVMASSPAAGPLDSDTRAETFADRTVGPTLATAGLGLLVGDLTAAGAILRPDYATGPALAFPLETLRDAALCARSGIVVRTHDAFERLAEVDLIVLDDDLDLGRLELEVAGVETRLPEPDLLRYAASAFRHLDDDRALALQAICLERRIHLLDLPAAGFDPGVTVIHGRWRIRVREYPTAPDGLHPLVVEIDGKAVGLIEFARSAAAGGRRAPCGGSAPGAGDDRPCFGTPRGRGRGALHFLVSTFT